MQIIQWLPMQLRTTKFSQIPQVTCLYHVFLVLEHQFVYPNLIKKKNTISCCFDSFFLQSPFTSPLTWSVPLSSLQFYFPCDITLSLRHPFNLLLDKSCRLRPRYIKLPNMTGPEGQSTTMPPLSNEDPYCSVSYSIWYSGWKLMFSQGVRFL